MRRHLCGEHLFGNRRGRQQMPTSHSPLHTRASRSLCLGDGLLRAVESQRDCAVSRRRLGVRHGAKGGGRALSGRGTHCSPSLGAWRVVPPCCGCAHTRDFHFCTLVLTRRPHTLFPESAGWLQLLLHLLHHPHCPWHKPKLWRPKGEKRL